MSPLERYMKKKTASGDVLGSTYVTETGGDDSYLTGAESLERKINANDRFLLHVFLTLFHGKLLCP